MSEFHYDLLNIFVSNCCRLLWIVVDTVCVRQKLQTMEKTTKSAGKNTLIEDNNNKPTWSVGTIVHAPLGSPTSKLSATSRAMVATINSHENTVSLIWEPFFPKPLSIVDSNVSDRTRCQIRFFITPHLKEISSSIGKQNDGAEEDDDENVPLSKLIQLFPFECGNNMNESTLSSELCKQHGDDLLRIRDYSAAISWYEQALSMTSTIEVGGTVIIQRGGRAVTADIDCMEDDEEENDNGATSTKILDITFMQDNQEKEESIQEQSVILAILKKDGQDRIQERILLNLARCLMQFSDLCPSLTLVQKESYRKAAILACTLAMTCASFHNDNNKININNINSTEEKARYLRAKVYVQLNKYKHAKMDLSYILKSNPTHADALKLKKDMERKQTVKKRTDKKLAKDMCHWVKVATDIGNEGNTETNGVSTDVVQDKRRERTVDTSYKINNACSDETSSSNSKYISPNLTFILFFIFTAILVSKLISLKNK